MNKAVSLPAEVDWGMTYQPTAHQRMELLRERLREQRNPTDQPLLSKLERCCKAWNGSYRCASPACVRCRFINIRHQQRETHAFLGHFSNSDLAMVTVVLGGTTDINRVAQIIRKSRDDTSNRFRSARRADPRWNDTYLRGWHELDAVGPQHFPILPPERIALVPSLAPAALDGVSATWLPTYHAIMFTNGLAVEEIAEQFSRQWKLPHQVDVVAFDEDRPVDMNLREITSYANKFHCSVSLEGKVKEQWPIDWQAEMFGWLNLGTRKPYERLFLEINQFTPKKKHLFGSKASPILPLPMSYGFTGLHTHYNTGAML